MKIQPIFGIESWSQRNKRESKSLGSLILVLGSLVSIYYFGLTAGLLLFIIILMTLASLTILTVPLGIVNKWTLGITILLTMMVELLF